MTIQPDPAPSDLLLLHAIASKQDAETLLALLDRGCLPGLPSRAGAFTMLRAWLSEQPTRIHLTPPVDPPPPAAAFPHWGETFPKAPQEPGPLACEHLAARLWRMAAEGPGSYQPALEALLLDVWERAALSGWNTLACQMLAERAVDPAVLLRRRPPFKLLYNDAHASPWPHSLAWLGHADILQAWVQADVQVVHARDADGRTPLFFAALPSAARVLLAAGADPQHADHRGLSPLASSRTAKFQSRITEASRALMEQAAPANDTGARLVGWCQSGLPAGIDRQTLQTLSAWTAPQHTPAGVRRWGPLAWMARNLPGYLPSHGYGGVALGSQEVEQAMARWKDFAAALPPAWIAHESVPGLADGWLWWVAWTRTAANAAGAQARYAKRQDLDPGKVFDAMLKTLTATLAGREQEVFKKIAAAEALSDVRLDSLDWLVRSQGRPLPSDVSAMDAVAGILERPALATMFIDRVTARSPIQDALGMEVAALRHGSSPAPVTRFWNAALGLPSALCKKSGARLLLWDHVEDMARRGIWPEHLESRHARRRLQVVLEASDETVHRNVEAWLTAMSGRRALAGPPRGKPQPRPRRRA